MGKALASAPHVFAESGRQERQDAGRDRLVQLRLAGSGRRIIQGSLEPRPGAGPGRARRVEINDMLEEATASINPGKCPVIVAGKNGQNSLRANLDSSFSQLVAVVLSAASDADLARTVETLKAIVDPFVMMTSFSHPFYRYAFTEATMSMAQSLLRLGRSTNLSLEATKRLGRTTAAEGPTKSPRPTTTKAAFWTRRPRRARISPRRLWRPFLCTAARIFEMKCASAA